jgi:hypothetical protein
MCSIAVFFSDDVHAALMLTAGPQSQLCLSHHNRGMGPMAAHGGKHRRRSQHMMKEHLQHQWKQQNQQQRLGLNNKKQGL